MAEEYLMKTTRKYICQERYKKLKKNLPAVETCEIRNSLELSHG